MEVFQQRFRAPSRSPPARGQGDREEFAKEPPLRQQFVDGAPRQVKSYRRSWLIDTLKRFRAQLAGG